MSKVPTVADLRAKQVENTVSAISGSLAERDLATSEEVLYSLLEQLGAGHTERDVALAAINLVHHARGAHQDDQEIPDASDWAGGEGNRGKGKHGKGKHGKGNRGKDKFGEGKPFKGKGKRGGKFSGDTFDGDKGYLYVNVGSKVGMRPGDLVGAIANEGGLSGNDIGPIKISEHYSVVGVPESDVDQVVKAMKRTSIRGKQAKIRRYTT